MEEDEKVECNDSNESGKNRSTEAGADYGSWQRQEERSTKRKSLLWRENMVSDPGFSLSPYMK